MQVRSSKASALVSLSNTYAISTYAAALPKRYSGLIAAC